MELKGTGTEQNLLAAFAGESQARNRYTFFAKKAKKEGFIQIGAIFEDTAAQEQAHASRLFKLMQGGEVEITAAFPAGKNAATLENLRASADGERHEYTEMYPEFAKTAREEGLEAIARVFEALANAEERHGKRFEALAGNIENDRVFKRDESVLWAAENAATPTAAPRRRPDAPPALTPRPTSR